MQHCTKRPGRERKKKKGKRGPGLKNLETFLLQSFPVKRRQPVRPFAQSSSRLPVTNKQASRIYSRTVHNARRIKHRGENAQPVSRDVQAKAKNSIDECAGEGEDAYHPVLVFEMQDGQCKKQNKDNP